MSARVSVGLTSRARRGSCGPIPRAGCGGISPPSRWSEAGRDGSVSGSPRSRPARRARSVSGSKSHRRSARRGPSASGVQTERTAGRDAGDLLHIDVNQVAGPITLVAARRVEVGGAVTAVEPAETSAAQDRTRRGAGPRLRPALLWISIVRPPTSESAHRGPTRTRDDYLEYQCDLPALCERHDHHPSPPPDQVASCTCVQAV